MTYNTQSLNNAIAKLDLVAGKTTLNGELGFILQNFRAKTENLLGVLSQRLTHAEQNTREAAYASMRDECSGLWSFYSITTETYQKYREHILAASADAADHKQFRLSVINLAARAHERFGKLTSELANSLSGVRTDLESLGEPTLEPLIAQTHLEGILRHISGALTTLSTIDRDVVTLLEAIRAVASVGSTADDESADDERDSSEDAESADDDRDSSEDAESADAAPTERSIPRPPATSNSRKRPCRKQGGRKQERRGNAGSVRNVKERKLNQYSLDPITGLVTSVRPGQEIAKGSRVIEQLPGNSKPSVAAFYDASLLPTGSTVVARWGEAPAELDKQLVGRAGRLAKLAGYGDQARSTMFDQLGRAANPNAALEALILELGGTDALTVEPGTLTTTLTRDAMQAVVLRAVNTGNEKLIEMQDNLPVRLTPEQRLVDALSDLPGMIESLEEDGNGSVLRVRGIRFDDKPVICEKLRAAGGRNVDVANTRIEKDGRSVKAYIVSARFNVSAIEIAAARTGRQPEISYHLADDGSVSAEYGVDLYGTRVTTTRIPCEPSWASVEMLVKELERSGDANTLNLLTKLAIEFDSPAQALTASVGPVRTVEQAREALASIRAEDILTEGYADEVANAAREIRAADGRRIPVEYRGGAAILAEFSFHPTDIRPSLLPGSVLVGEEEIPTRVRRVRFETKKGSNRPRVIVEETEITELTERLAAYLDGKDLKQTILTEVRENFIAEATRSMASTLVNPPESLATARDPEAVAKSRVISKHLDPYAVEGGDLVHLVEVLAARSGDAESAAFFRRTAELLRADVTMIDTLEALGEEAPPKIRRICAGITAGLNAGASLSEAMLAFPDTFDEVTLAHIASGEASGTLPEKMDLLAISMDKRSALCDAWSRWCRENVKVFRDEARERRKRRTEPSTDFFGAVGAASHAKSFLVEAGAALLTNRLGRDVTTEEFIEVAREARVTKEHVFTAVDRGRALAQYIKRNG